MKLWVLQLGIVFLWVMSCQGTPSHYSRRGITNDVSVGMNVESNVGQSKDKDRGIPRPTNPHLQSKEDEDTKEEDMVEGGGEIQESKVKGPEGRETHRQHGGTTTAKLESGISASLGTSHSRNNVKGDGRPNEKLGDQRENERPSNLRQATSEGKKEEEAGKLASKNKSQSSKISSEQSVKSSSSKLEVEHSMSKESAVLTSAKEEKDTTFGGGEVQVGKPSRKHTTEKPGQNSRFSISGSGKYSSENSGSTASSVKEEGEIEKGNNNENQKRRPSNKQRVKPQSELGGTFSVNSESTTSSNRQFKGDSMKDKSTNRPSGGASTSGGTLSFNAGSTVSGVKGEREDKRPGSKGESQGDKPLQGQSERLASKELQGGFSFHSGSTISSDKREGESGTNRLSNGQSKGSSTTGLENRYSVNVGTSTSGHSSGREDRKIEDQKHRPLSEQSGGHSVKGLESRFSVNAGSTISRDGNDVRAESKNEEVRPSRGQSGASISGGFSLNAGSAISSNKDKVEMVDSNGEYEMPYPESSGWFSASELKDERFTINQGSTIFGRKDDSVCRIYCFPRNKVEDKEKRPNKIDSSKYTSSSMGGGFSFNLGSAVSSHKDEKEKPDSKNLDQDSKYSNKNIRGDSGSSFTLNLGTSLQQVKERNKNKETPSKEGVSEKVKQSQTQTGGFFVSGSRESSVNSESTVGKQSTQSGNQGGRRPTGSSGGQTSSGGSVSINLGSTVSSHKGGKEKESKDVDQDRKSSNKNMRGTSESAFSLNLGTSLQQVKEGNKNKDTPSKGEVSEKVKQSQTGGLFVSGSGESSVNSESTVGKQSTGNEGGKRPTGSSGGHKSSGGSVFINVGSTVKQSKSNEGREKPSIIEDIQEDKPNREKYTSGSGQFLVNAGSSIIGNKQEGKIERPNSVSSNNNAEIQHRPNRVLSGGVSIKSESTVTSSKQEHESDRLSSIKGEEHQRETNGGQSSTGIGSSLSVNAGSKVSHPKEGENNENSEGEASNNIEKNKPTRRPSRVTSIKGSGGITVNSVTNVPENQRDIVDKKPAVESSSQVKESKHLQSHSEISVNAGSSNLSGNDGEEEVEVEEKEEGSKEELPNSNSESEVEKSTNKPNRETSSTGVKGELSISAGSTSSKDEGQSESSGGRPNTNKESSTQSNKLSVKGSVGISANSESKSEIGKGEEVRKPDKTSQRPSKGSSASGPTGISVNSNTKTAGGDKLAAGGKTEGHQSSKAEGSRHSQASDKTSHRPSKGASASGSAGISVTSNSNTGGQVAAGVKTEGHQSSKAEGNTASNSQASSGGSIGGSVGAEVSLG